MPGIRTGRLRQNEELNFFGWPGGLIGDDRIIHLGAPAVNTPIFLVLLALNWQ